MLNFDITLWLTIIQALILTFILNAILIRPIMQTLEERKRRFNALRGEIGALARKAEEALREYEESLAEARSRAQAERESLKAQGREEEREILGVATKEAEAYKERVLSEVRAQFEGVRKQLLEEVAVFSRAMAEKVLGRPL